MMNQEMKNQKNTHSPVKVFLLTFVACLTVAGTSYVWANKETKKDKVDKMMEAAHQGKNSPLAIVKREVKKEKPDWALLAKNTTPLFKLGEEIKDDINYQSDPRPYRKSIKLLMAATEAKDVTEARVAMKGLMNSCLKCHQYGE